MVGRYSIPPSAGYIDLLKIDEKAKAARMVEFFIRGLLLPIDQYGDFIKRLLPHSFGESSEERDREIEQYIQYIKLDRLNDFQFVRLDSIMLKRGPELNARHNVVMHQNQVQPYGAQNIREFSILFHWNGEFRMGSATMRQYDSGWYISTLHSNILKTMPYSEMTKVVTEAEYDEIVKSAGK